MDPNLDEEECIRIQSEYKKLFIIKDKLEQKKKKLESEREEMMREKKVKNYL